MAGGTQETQQIHRSPVCHQLQLKHSQVILQSFTELLSTTQSFQAPVPVLGASCQGCHKSFQLRSPPVLKIHIFKGWVQVKPSIFPRIQLLLHTTKYHSGWIDFFPEHPPASRDTSAANAAPSILGGSCPGLEPALLSLRSPALASSASCSIWHKTHPAFLQRLTAAGTNPLPPSRKALKTASNQQLLSSSAQARPEPRSSLSLRALITTQ